MTLRLEKRAAATQATAEVLEMAVELESGENMSIAELPIEDTAEHTQACLSEQVNNVVDPQ